MSEAAEDVLELAPFRGLRYASQDARALIDSPDLDLALALAPPYDVVDAGTVSALIRAEPHNAVRLTLPPAAEPPTGLSGPDRYRRAAGTLRRWIDEGVLVRDAEASLYVYEQTGTAGVRQRGLIGALRLPPPGSGTVRAHEEVFDVPVADRARLMAETRANLEPIFLLYQGGTGAARGAAATAATAPRQDEPLVDTLTGDGTRHRLWAITDPAQHSAVSADLATRTAMIADGHHRYAAYQRLRAAHPKEPSWGYGLALLVDSDSSPPCLGAIHRVFTGLDAADAARAAAAHARVDDLTGVPVEEAAARLERAARRGPSLLLADARRGFLVREVDPAPLAAALPERSEEWRALHTAALIHLFLPLWGLRDEDALLVHDDAEEAAAAAEPGRRTAVILPPLDVEDVYAVTARNELTPRKSTSFGPKPRTGLVLRALDPADPFNSDGKR
ncbi:DUF1015 domain-containing protein [Actinorugispora endophytica]|nr:DUF1015 domain-containing protein [Actinorugispora endophytica]